MGSSRTTTDAIRVDPTTDEIVLHVNRSALMKMKVDPTVGVPTHLLTNPGGRKFLIELTTTSKSDSYSASLSSILALKCPDEEEIRSEHFSFEIKSEHLTILETISQIKQISIDEILNRIIDPALDSILPPIEMMFET